jgi:glucokinase
MDGPQLLVGVNARLDRVHTIIVREEANEGLRLMGEHRLHGIIREPDQNILVERIRNSIREAIDDAQVSPSDLLAIGIAASGQVDQDNGVILFTPLLGLSNVPLAGLLQEEFACHIVLVNDVGAQGIGEQKIGAGKHIQQLAYLHVGYGIGSSIIINGELYTGANNLAGEFGHTTIDLHGPLCTCGNTGCLEMISSRFAIGRRLQQLYQEGHATLLSSLTDFSQEPLDVGVTSIAEAIDQDDALTIQVVEEAADVFGAGIANVINFLNPHTIILGGDVIDELDLYFEHAVAAARKRCLGTHLKHISIVRGMLGTTAGAYGAAVYAKQHLTRANNQTA